MNARTNPFASRHVESLAYQCTDVSLEDIMDRLETLHYRAAISGPEGSGKTTLLETIGARLRGQGFQTRYVRFDEESRKLNHRFFKSMPEKPGAGQALLIDGAEQLSWLSWKRLCRFTQRAGAVVITTHAPAKMPTLVETSTSPGLLHDLVSKLLGKKELVDRLEINRLYEAHSGNIRLALRELYDVWAAK